MTQKFYPMDKFFLSSSNFFLLKNTFKETLHDLFKIFILFNTVSHIKLNFKLKLTQKCVLLKTLKKLGKPGKNFWKKRMATLWTYVVINFLKQKVLFLILLIKAYLIKCREWQLETDYQAWHWTKTRIYFLLTIMDYSEMSKISFYATIMT